MVHAAWNGRALLPGSSCRIIGFVVRLIHGAGAGSGDNIELASSCRHGDLATCCGRGWPEGPMTKRCCSQEDSEGRKEVHRRSIIPLKWKSRRLFVRPAL